MGKIEKGCLALVIEHANYAGAVGVVTVGDFIGINKDFANVDLWEIDKEIEYHSGPFMMIREAFKMCPERYLMRLDDPDIEQELEEENLKEICYTFTT